MSLSITNTYDLQPATPMIPNMTTTTTSTDGKNKNNNNLAKFFTNTPLSGIGPLNSVKPSTTNTTNNNNNPITNIPAPDSTLSLTTTTTTTTEQPTRGKVDLTKFFTPQPSTTTNITQQQQGTTISTSVLPLPPRTPIPAHLDGVAGGFDNHNNSNALIDNNNNTLDIASSSFGKQGLDPFMSQNSNANTLNPNVMNLLNTNFTNNNNNGLGTGNNNNSIFGNMNAIDPTTGGTTATPTPLNLTIQAFFRYTQALQCSLSGATALATNVLGLLQTFLFFKHTLTSLLPSSFSNNDNIIGNNNNNNHDMSSITKNNNNGLIGSIKNGIYYFLQLLKKCTINPISFIIRLIVQTIDMIIRLITCNIIQLIDYRRTKIINVKSNNNGRQQQFVKVVDYWGISKMFKIISKWCYIASFLSLSYAGYVYIMQLENQLSNNDDTDDNNNNQYDYSQQQQQQQQQQSEILTQHHQHPTFLAKQHQQQHPITVNNNTQLIQQQQQQQSSSLPQQQQQQSHYRRKHVEIPRRPAKPANKF